MSLIPNLKKMQSKNNPPPCSAVIAAAGGSQRMGGIDKLFALIDGIPVLAHTLSAFQSCASIAEIIVVTRDDRLTDVVRICEMFGITKASNVIVGGATRLISVLNGVFAVSKKAELIAVHDGARPCIGIDVIERAIVSAAKNHAAAPAVAVSSTIKRVEAGIVKETVDRADLFEVQTPQVFDAALIKAALTNAKNKSIDVTDDCYAAEIIGLPVHIVDGSRQNIKITTNEDLLIAEAILGSRRTGQN